MHTWAHAIGCKWRGWGGTEPHRCVFNGGEEVEPRGSDPTDSQTTPRSVGMAAHVKMNEILPLCRLLTWVSISCNIIILKKVLKKPLTFVCAPWKTGLACKNSAGLANLPCHVPSFLNLSSQHVSIKLYDSHPSHKDMRWQRRESP